MNKANIAFIPAISSPLSHLPCGPSAAPLPGPPSTMNSLLSIGACVAAVAMLTSCSDGKFSKSDCDMGLKTSVWYAAFDKGKFTGPELIIGATIAANKLAGFELDEKELRGQSNIVMDVGSGMFKEKPVAACLEKVDLNFVNRSAGERKTACFAEAYLSDKEFKMFRSLKVMECGKVAEEMPGWIEANKVTGMKQTGKTR
jgi:hypothetical protein